MRNFFKTILLFVLFLLSGRSGYAQLYPVALTPVFYSPYSIQISDYATSMDTKMQLLLNPTDITIVQRQVRLKLFIQGNGINIQSNEYIQGVRPIYINGGELQTLTNVDIAALFRLENLQGISAAQYANPLPEGMYSFCFEAYDFVTNQKISQKSCASLYLVLNDPPLLNTPQRNEQIVANDFPNILFTWTPRQMNATNVSYKFELKQLFDATLDPQIGFQMAPILYEETFYSTALLYNLNMPTLTPGMKYAWRVRAISSTGLSENAVFKNDGYSEIYSFKYAATCAAPTFTLSEAQGTKKVKLSWQGTPEHTRYQVQYKKQNIANARWFSETTMKTQIVLTNLEPGVTYDFRVGSSCDAATENTQYYTYSNQNTFTMPTETNAVSAYNCGIVPQITIENQKPITNLIQSETFTAGDFPVTILELSDHSPYSGKGYIIVPYLADTKIAVEFNNIVVNTDYQLISGVVETTYDPSGKNIVDLEDFTGSGPDYKIEETVPFEIEKIVIDNNGDIIVNGKSGEQITIPGGKNTFITDSKGNVYHVDNTGNGSDIPIDPAKGGKSTTENTDGVDKNGLVTEFTAKGIIIKFSVNEKESKYAFDVMPNNATAALKKLYKTVGDFPLPYKAVVNGDSDKILAQVAITDPNVKLEDIVFKSETGGKVDAELEGTNTFKLTVKGTFPYAEEQIVATIKQGEKWKVIAAFMLIHISPKDVNVALVATDVDSQNKFAQITEKTNEIYSKVGVTINFSNDSKLYDISNIVPGNSIPTEKTTLTSTYSAEQQAVNSNYPNTNASRYILFITNKGATKNQHGYMRLNGQYGYVFNSGTSKTAAHELGHGVFKLEHPFELYKTSESSTDLLMDDSEGTVLNHLDWKQINDPAFKLYSFQSQASGEHVDREFVLKEDGYFLTPSNKLIKLSKGTQILFTCDEPQQYKNGPLFSFKTPDGFYWHNKAKLALNETSFDGYFKATEKAWIKNDKGQLIAYSDPKFSYNKAGIYSLYFVNFVRIDNNKSEYRILKQEIQITSQQISSNSSFSGVIQNLVFKGGEGLVETINSTGCNMKPEEEIGSYITSIESKSKKAILKIYKNAITGKYTVEAELKGDGNVKTKSQKAAIEKQMSALATQKINELGGLQNKISQRLFETTDDGGGFYVKDMNGQEWLGTICDLGSDVWENAALPENYWNQDNEGFKNSTIHLPPTLSGVSDGAIGIVSDYPQLVKLGYNVATKEEVRTGIWTAVKNITPSSILDAASGAIKDKWDKYTNSKPYVTSHELGKDGVTVVSTLMGASFLKAGDDALEESVEKTGKEITSKIDDVLINGLDGADDIAKKNLKEALTTGEIPKEIVDGLQDEINDTAVKKGKKLSWDEVKAFFKRGNDFNKKASRSYDYNEIHLINGKRLDSYIPGKEIISRKATTLSDIKPETFEGYLKELTTKYEKGMTVKSNKYSSGIGAIDGQVLSGEYMLEIPLSNKTFFESSENLKKIATKYEVTIKYLEE